MRLDREIDDDNRRIVAEIKTCGTTLIRLYGVGTINAALCLATNTTNGPSPVATSPTPRWRSSTRLATTDIGGLL